ncbi:amidohydrolase [Vibrio cionasavignyae]|uniref:amidohydrolase n=1 Tax=Vibrio cionasavignyae TaxID=2910252 RepID=UPI003D0AFB4F
MSQQFDRININEQCHHEGEIHCSCCSPVWKYLLPSNEIVASQIAHVNYERSVAQEKHLPLIFHTEHHVDPPMRQFKALGYIQTMAGGQDLMVQAVGVIDGKFVAVGSFKDVVATMPKSAEKHLIHSGQTLLPGLIEPHLHIIPTAAYNLMVDVGPFYGQDLLSNAKPNNPYNIKFIKKQLRTGASGNKKQWIMGRGVDPSLLVDKDKTFNAQVLDGVSDTQPVFLMNASMHLAYINSVAIEMVQTGLMEFSVSDDGILKELAQIVPVMKFIASQMYATGNEQAELREKLDREVQKIFSKASERGVTYMLDAGVLPQDLSASQSVTSGETQTPYGYPDPIFNQPAYLSWCASKAECEVRVSGALATTSLRDFNQNIIGKYQPNMGDEMFNIAYIKLIADGSNQGLTGYQYTPYQCDENFERFDQMSATQSNRANSNSDEKGPLAKQTNEGIFNYGYPLEFNALVNRAVDGGWPVMVHSNGDHSTTRTLQAFKQAGVSQSSKQQRRDRIEHASLLSDEHLSDMEILGISPSFLIGHVGYWGWVFQQTIFGTDKANLLDRCHSALNRHGMKISLHSDNSVTPLGPLRFMEQAITRIMEGAPQTLSPQVLNDVECISRFEALKSVTYDAAWQCHAEKWVGSLETGKCADFVLLSENPVTYVCEQDGFSAKGMRNIPVLETWKGGVKRYSTEDELNTRLQKKPSLRVALKQSETV